jgi:hypothetical protein
VRHGRRQRDGFRRGSSDHQRHDAVEEFLACGIWLLSDCSEFEVEKEESPLLKVVVSMSKVIPAIGEQEARETFEARITLVANQLVGNYSSSKHRTCSKELRYGRLNHVFELAGVSYQPHLEPIAHMMKRRQAATAVVEALTSRKTSGGKKWKKASSRSGDKTAKQETMQAKALKASKKFSVQKSEVHPSGLSVGEKASSAKAPPRLPMSTKTGGRKLVVAAAAGDNSGYVSMHVIDMLASSASEGEASPLKRCQKHACKSPSPKASLKSSGVATVEGSIL